jgi:hypothetical protein
MNRIKISSLAPAAATAIPPKKSKKKAAAVIEEKEAATAASTSNRHFRPSARRSLLATDSTPKVNHIVLWSWIHEYS